MQTHDDVPDWFDDGLELMPPLPDLTGDPPMTEEYAEAWQIAYDARVAALAAIRELDGMNETDERAESNYWRRWTWTPRPTDDDPCDDHGNERAA